MAQTFTVQVRDATALQITDAVMDWEVLFLFHEETSGQGR